MSAETPSLADVIDFTVQDALAGVFKAIPGKVQTYDPATELAYIIPMMKRVTRNADGERIVDTLPVLPSIPVLWTRGGGYFLRMPLVPGDGGLILFPDTDIGAWFQSGQVSDPGDERLHAIGGAVFLPGLETAAKALSTNPGHLVFGKEGGPAVHLDASTVQLGAAGGQFIALANLVQTALDNIRSTFNTHVHVETGGSTAVPTTLMTAQGPVAATKVKAT